MDSFLKIALCEDRSEDSAMLLDLIDKSGILCKCDVFSSGEGLLEAFFPGKYHIIFLDIYMGGIRGIETAEKIRAEDENVILAFTTTSLDHALEGYRLNVSKYLEKPLTQKDVSKALELAESNRKSAAYINLLIDGKNTDIPVSSILYFEQQNHAVSINTVTGVLKTSQSVKLSHIAPMLKRPPFLRCHHSYIVNLDYVQRLDKEFKTFTMKNGRRVYIRHQDIKKTTALYEEYLFQKARGGS